MTKTGNCLTMISLDLNYGLHHCNTEKVLVYSPDTNNCVHLKEDRIQKSVVISFSMGLEQEPRFRLSLTAKRSAEDEVVSVRLCSRLLFSNSICKLSVHKKSSLLFYLTLVQWHILLEFPISIALYVSQDPCS